MLNILLPNRKKTHMMSDLAKLREMVRLSQKTKVKTTQDGEVYVENTPSPIIDDENNLFTSSSSIVATEDEMVPTLVGTTIPSTPSPQQVPAQENNQKDVNSEDEFAKALREHQTKKLEATDSQQQPVAKKKKKPRKKKKRQHVEANSVFATNTDQHQDSNRGFSKTFHEDEEDAEVIVHEKTPQKIFTPQRIPFQDNGYRNYGKNSFASPGASSSWHTPMSDTPSRNIKVRFYSSSEESMDEHSTRYFRGNSKRVRERDDLIEHLPSKRRREERPLELIPDNEMKELQDRLAEREKELQDLEVDLKQKEAMLTVANENLYAAEQKQISLHAKSKLLRQQLKAVGEQIETCVKEVDNLATKINLHESAVQNKKAQIKKAQATKRQFELELYEAKLHNQIVRESSLLGGEGLQINSTINNAEQQPITPINEAQDAVADNFSLNRSSQQSDDVSIEEEPLDVPTHQPQTENLQPSAANEPTTETNPLKSHSSDVFAANTEVFFMMECSGRYILKTEHREGTDLIFSSLGSKIKFSSDNVSNVEKTPEKKSTDTLTSFTSYESPLAMFREYKDKSTYHRLVKRSSSNVSKPELDCQRFWCKRDTISNKCTDPNCTYLHIEDYQTTEEPDNRSAFNKISETLRRRSRNQAKSTPIRDSSNSRRKCDLSVLDLMNFDKSLSKLITEQNNSESRYYDSLSLEEYENHLNKNPKDIAYWIKYTVRSISERGASHSDLVRRALSIVTKALEVDSECPSLWLVYLHVYNSNYNDTRTPQLLDSILRSAVTKVPDCILVWLKAAAAKSTLTSKLDVLNQALSHFRYKTKLDAKQKSQNLLVILLGFC